MIASKAKKPDMTSPSFSELIKDLQHEMGTVTEIKDSNRASAFKDHLNMVAEGMGGLQWVVFEGKPADYVAEILGGVQLFGNRVLKEYKEKCVRRHASSQPLKLTHLQGPRPRRLRPGLLLNMEEPASLHPQTLPRRRHLEQLWRRPRSGPQRARRRSQSRPLSPARTPGPCCRRSPSTTSPTTATTTSS